MKKLYFLFLLLLTFSSFAQNVTITKIIETGCPDPFVKTVELYVDGTVNFANPGEVVLNYMLNGAPWAANQIDISSLGTVTDSFVYIVRDIPLMQSEFPSTTFNASNTVVVTTATNGDDGYQVVLNGSVVSQFGKTETDADLDTDSNWNHNDTVAIRISGIADIGVWDPTQWEIRAEDDLDTNTSCQTSGATNLETYFASLGGTYPLGSGSGWTPSGATCTAVLSNPIANCDTTTNGSMNDTYTATVDFTGANTGNIFIVSSTAGSISGDDPTSNVSGTIIISGIPEGTDITVTVSDTADGGVCNLTQDVESPACESLVINELLFDPATDITGDANADGVRDALDDEFIEFFNNSNVSLDVSGYTISDAAALRHTFPPSTVIEPYGVIVVFGGGSTTLAYEDVIFQTASEGQLNLSNGGDVVTVANGSGDIVAVYDSVTEGINISSDQSVTRSPDITGGFALHTDANASLLQSPGLRVSGATLSEDQFSLPDFKLFPNPVSDGIVFIETPFSGTIQVRVYNILGKEVLSTNLSNNQFNVTNLKTGMYLLKILQNGLTTTKKLVIE